MSLSEEKRREKRREEERRGEERATLSHFLRFLPDAALEEPAAPGMMAAASDMVELLWPRFASLLRGAEVKAQMSQDANIIHAHT